MGKSFFELDTLQHETAEGAKYTILKFVDGSVQILPGHLSLEQIKRELEKR